MNEKTLNLLILWLIRKNYASKQAIALSLVDTGKIVVSEKFKYSNNGSKYFIGYLDDDGIIRPLCIILPKISGYIKYFDDGGKNTSFKIEDEGVYVRCNVIWNNIKITLNIKFQPIYDEKYIKSKVRTFNGVINTLFDDEIHKEGNHYICIALICNDSILKVYKKNYPQVYLEQCK